MPAPRKRTVLGRAPGRDRGGHVLAELEPQELWVRRAESAGLNTDEWYREAIAKLHELSRRPITRRHIDEMQEVEDAMRFGLEQAGIPETFKDKPLIPNRYKLYDLLWRTLENRGMVEWTP